MSGRMIGVAEPSYFKIITEIPIEELKKSSDAMWQANGQGLKSWSFV